MEGIQRILTMAKFYN